MSKKILNQLKNIDELIRLCQEYIKNAPDSVEAKYAQVELYKLVDKSNKLRNSYKI